MNSKREEYQNWETAMEMAERGGEGRTNESSPVALD